MKKRNFLVSMLAMLLVSACGGGGDNNAGAPIALNTVPAEVAFNSQVIVAPGTVLSDYLCAAGVTQDIFVNGGAGPYIINNTYPLGMSIDRTEVSRGESFKITLTGACMDEVLLLIKDKNNNQVTVKVTNSNEEAS